MSKPRPHGPVPNAVRLHEAALAHLARFAATEASLRRVLQSRIDRWARAAEQAGEADVAPRAAQARQEAAAVARKLAAAGTVDDAAFAESRVRRLLRSGRSRRGALAHLAQKGVDAETAGAALPVNEASELDAALAFCRRRRFGPFAREPGDAEAHRRALGAFGRAGFGRDVAEQALGMTPEDATDRLLATRQT